MQDGAVDNLARLCCSAVCYLPCRAPPAALPARAAALGLGLVCVLLRSDLQWVDVDAAQGHLIVG